MRMGPIAFNAAMIPTLKEGFSRGAAVLAWHFCISALPVCLAYQYCTD
jgi:hypothetical protein